MSIGLIVAGCCVVPSCFAIFSFVKYRLCSGHFEVLESGHRGEEASLVKGALVVTTCLYMREELLIVQESVKGSP